jgi:hypothetical protein
MTLKLRQRSSAVLSLSAQKHGTHWVNGNAVIITVRRVVAAACGASAIRVARVVPRWSY